MNPTRLRRLAVPLLLGALVAGCANLDVTNPNQRSTATFWRTSNDAVQGTNAIYAGLLPLGVYSRWQVFANDLRTDIAFSTSPNPDIRNFGRFAINNYDLAFTGETFRDHYQAIFRANQAIANIPGIDMDPTLLARLVGEAKFLRALLYFNLVNYYGGNIPLVVEPTYDPSTRVGSSTTAAVYAQIEKDLNEAIPDLPLNYGASDRGRVTRGAAQTLLGKALLQQGPTNASKYAQAVTVLNAVVASAQYALVSNYDDNFVGGSAQYNRESIFEVAMGDEGTLSKNIPGLSFGRFVAPCGDPGFCDMEATQWFYQQFLLEPTTTGGRDPRLDATLFYYQPTKDSLMFQLPYNRLWDRAGSNTRVFFRKYTEWYDHSRPFNRFDEPINFRVLRFADVLLMRAEALNEQGQTAAAKADVDSVRKRAQLAPSTATTQAAMRAEIRHQRTLEFGLEAQRWFDLVRWGFAANLEDLKTHDADFQGFTVGKSELLPLPLSETERNPLVHQNPGW